MKKVAWIWILVVSLSFSSGASAQELLSKTSPACLTDRVICVLEDYYDVDTAPEHLKAITEQRIEDGTVTLRELYYHSRTRKSWLKLNGYPENWDGSTVLPKGTVRLAMASKVDAQVPLVSPVCSATPIPSDCHEMQMRTDIPIEPRALFTFYRIGYSGEVEDWLTRNGLDGRGITRFSLVPISQGSKLLWVR